MIAQLAFATGISPRELELCDGDYLEHMADLLIKQGEAAQR